MADYLTPGVYVEEIELGPPPIAGVSTSIPGFVGRTQMGPVLGPPQLVTSFSDFANQFGGFLAASTDPTDTTTFLAHSVNGFFQNGGQIAYVQRVVGAGATPCSLNMTDAVVEGGSPYFLTQPAQQMPLTMDRVTLVSARFISAGTKITLTEQTAAGVVSDAATVQEVNGDSATFTAPVTHRYTTAAVVEVPAPAGYQPATALTLTAVSPGTWGQNVLVTVTPSSRTSAVVLPVRAQLQPMSIPLTLASAMTAGDLTNAVLAPAASVLLLQGGDDLYFSDDNTPPGSPGEAATIAVGGVDTATNTITLSAALSHPYDPATGGAVTLQSPPALRIDSNATATPDVQVTVTSTSGLAPGQAVQVQGGGTALTGDVQAVGPGNVVALTLTTAFRPTESVAATAVLILQGVPTDQLNLSGAANLNPGDILELTDTSFTRTYNTVLSVNGNAVTFANPVPATIASGAVVRTTDFALGLQLTSTSPITGLVSVVTQETYPFLNFAPGSPLNAVTALEVSALVTATQPATANPAPQGYPTTINPSTFTSSAPLTGGSDGATPTADDYIGDPAAGPGQRTGIQSLQDVDQIAIIAAPGMADPNVHSALIDQCETLKYRFAVIEAPRGSTIQEVQTYRNQFDTRYAAIYYPWIAINDPLTGNNVVAPPSGYVIGVYAQVDNTRGVYKAPANEPLLSITGLELTLSAGEQGVLNEPANVNVLRDFRSGGRGYRIWGARCITSETDWKYVNVRRLFIYLEHSIDQGTQWVVFEPNDEQLWARARQSVTAFLTSVWRSGALVGQTADQAFFVTCDNTTMTQDDIENGRLIMIIGVAPVYPAEFVIIRIGQQAAGSTVSD